MRWRRVRFVDRRDAGRQLADALTRTGLHDPVLVALPRGGVPVGFEVAAALDAPMDVLVARKVGAPGHAEFGIGAIAEGGVRVADRATLAHLGIDDAEFARLADAEQAELERRVVAYRGGRTLPDLRGRDVVVIDDGLATGVTADAAIRAARRLQPARVLLAVPVGAADAAARLMRVADEVVCVHRPDRFRAVGEWYEHFDQTTDAEVLDLLARTHGGGPGAAAPR